jgi:tRNA A-37 threonylcarbamoyl transferase component Bud32
MKIQIAGVEFTQVQELPMEMYELVGRAIEAYRSASQRERNHMDKIAEVLGDEISSGHFGCVFELGEDYILKVEKPWNKHDFGYVSRDGEILEELQGIPCIPQVYIYDSSNDFIVIQKIKGITVKEYVDIEGFELPESFNYEYAVNLLEDCDRLVKQRGWQIADAHRNNCMIDYEGNFWIVDVGLFDHIESVNKGWQESCGKHVDLALNGLQQVYNTHCRRYKQVDEQLELEFRQVKPRRAKFGLPQGFEGLQAGFIAMAQKMRAIDVQALGREIAYMDSSTYNEYETSLYGYHSPKTYYHECYSCSAEIKQFLIRCPKCLHNHINKVFNI